MAIVWQPSEAYAERANVTRFMRAHGIPRRAIRATVSGGQAGDLSSLEDPEALEAIRPAVGPDG